MMSVMFFTPLLVLSTVCILPANILDSTATCAYNNLDQLVDKADCIILAKKASPFRSMRNVVSDSAQRIPAYKRLTYHFTALAVIKCDSGIVAPAGRFDVRDGYEDLALRTHLLYYQAHITMQSILQCYRPSININATDTLLLFIAIPRRTSRQKKARGTLRPATDSSTLCCRIRSPRR